MDSNNNNVVTKSQDDEFDYLKPENVEEELAKLKLLDEAYDSEDDTRVSPAILIEWSNLI